MEELGVAVETEQIKYLAFAREFGRAGKPQFFFLFDLKQGVRGLSVTRLQTCWRMYGNKEHRNLFALNGKQAEVLVGHDASAIRQLLKSLGPGKLKPSEELRMNLALALEYQQRSVA